MTKRIYKTLQGKTIDMDALLAKNETMPAVGNVRMNARGDELGPGGKIIRRREDVVAEYYEDNPNATPQRGTPPAATAPTKAAPPPVAQEKQVKKVVAAPQPASTPVVQEQKPNE